MKAHHASLLTSKFTKNPRTNQTNHPSPSTSLEPPLALPCLIPFIPFIPPAFFLLPYLTLPCLIPPRALSYSSTRDKTSYYTTYLLQTSSRVNPRSFYFKVETRPRSHLVSQKDVEQQSRNQPRNEHQHHQSPNPHIPHLYRIIYPLCRWQQRTWIRSRSIQRHGKKKPFSYGPYLSKALTPAEDNYWPTELETGALV
jgi:hypothetical protein